MRGRQMFWFSLVTLASVAGAEWAAPPAAGRDMARAATMFLESLTPEQRAVAALKFDDPAREDWHYVPRRSPGIAFSEMTEIQRVAARNLFRSALSSRGMNKVEQIMLLDDVLRDMEQGRGPRRDPLAYFVAVFGTPGTAPWGWKIEGHHVSLNFTGAGELTAVTPAFLGANPAEVSNGDRAGMRVLAWEEDLARQLLDSLSDEQRRHAVIAGEAPPDILAGPGRSLDEIVSDGLDVASMTKEQRALIERLLDEYAGRLRHELADHELERIHADGIETVRFAWMGSDRRGEGHYYRLSGPTFVIEYDNTQNGANHVHTVWRDRRRDFGRDLLVEHYRRATHHEDDRHEAHAPAARSKEGMTVPSARLTVTRTSDREITMHRSFQASREAVFAAMTRPAQLRRWLSAAGREMTACEVDLKPGGAYRYVFTAPNGREFVMYGTFSDVVPGERIVHTESYVGVDWAPLVTTTRFTEHSGCTMVEIRVLYPSKEICDTDAPNLERADEAYARLDHLLAGS